MEIIIFEFIVSKNNDDELIDFNWRLIKSNLNELKNNLNHPFMLTSQDYYVIENISN